MSQLQHHGVLGMKWGVRRYQPYGEGGYNPKNKGNDAKAKASKVKESNKKKAITTTVNGAVKKCKNNYINVQSEIYRKKYKNMSEEDAKRLSEKRLDLMKKVAIASAAVGVGAVGVGLYRYYGRTYVDKIIKAGSTIQTLSDDADRLSKGQSFFTNFKSSDKKLYEKYFGDISILKKEGKYKITADITDDIRVASRNSAYKVYKQLVDTDKEFHDLDWQIRVFSGASMGMPDKSIGKKFRNYDIFNAASLGYGDDGNATKRANEIFFNALKAEGYGGVVDINDTLYSNLRGDSPVVLFDRRNVENIKADSKVTYDEVLKYGIGPSTDLSKNILLDTMADHPAFAGMYTQYMTLGLGMGICGKMYDKKVELDYKKGQKEKSIQTK